jgi:hypothetical protein
MSEKLVRIYHKQEFASFGTTVFHCESTYAGQLIMCITSKTIYNGAQLFRTLGFHWEIGKRDLTLLGRGVYDACNNKRWSQRTRAFFLER